MAVIIQSIWGTSPHCALLINTKSELNLRTTAALALSEQMYLSKGYFSRKGFHEIYLTISGLVLEPYQTDLSSRGTLGSF